MYNNPYINTYNQQQQLNSVDQNYLNMLDKEKEKIDTMKANYMNRYQSPAINQTFQLAPTNNGIRFANDIEDVKKELAIVETPFINKDYSILWIKNAKGEIRIFDLKEIIPKDEKDLIIEKMKLELDKLNNQIKEMNNNEQYYAKSHDEKWNEYESKQSIESIENEKSTNVSNYRTSKSKSK